MDMQPCHVTNKLMEKLRNLINDLLMMKIWSSSRILTSLAISCI